jgi:hypothetical protein
MYLRFRSFYRYLKGGSLLSDDGVTPTPSPTPPDPDPEPEPEPQYEYVPTSEDTVSENRSRWRVIV